MWNKVYNFLSFGKTLRNPNFGFRVSSAWKSTWGSVSSDVETIAISEASLPNRYESKCVMPPIVTSSTFMMAGAKSIRLQDSDSSMKFEYSRNGNPTRNHLEHYFSKIENSEHTITFGAGMSAISGVLLTLNQGDHVVCARGIYGGTYELLHDIKRLGITFDFVTGLEPKDFVSVIKPNTKMVYLESPSNPMLDLIDISAVTQAVKSVRKDIVVAVDNTFLTSIYQRPLELGADITAYSCSKYLSGHADLIMGAVTVNCHEIEHKLRRIQHMMGFVPSPFDCYMLIRSLKTLPIRMTQHGKNALTVAKFLEKHPKVKSVIHPGLDSHPQHSLALRQQSGHSGMVGFYIQGGYEEAVKFMEYVQVFRRAPSLGTDISLLTIPGQMSHYQLTDKERESLGMTDNYIRLSVGLEGSESLLKDLDQALNKAC